MRKGVFVLAGPPGAQKSSQAQATFQNNFTLKTGEDVLHYYETVMMKDDPSLLGPKKTFLLDAYSLNGKTTFDDEGNPIYVPIGNTVDALIKSVLRKGQEARNEGKPPPFDHVVIDEAGELWELRFEEICRLCSNGMTTDTRRAYGLLNTWTTKIMDDLKRLKTVGIGAVLLAHDMEPDQESGKKGGAKFPSGPVSRKISGKADGTLMRMCLDIEPDELDGETYTKYFWQCKPSQHWVMKMRGLRPTDVARIEDLELKEIIELAGWDL